MAFFQTKTSRIFFGLSVALTICTFALILLCSRHETKTSSFVQNQVTEIQEATLTIGGNSTITTFPLTLKKLPKGEPIEITFFVSPMPDDNLYISAVNTKVTVQIENETIFRYEDSYEESDIMARYKKDPAKVVELLPIGKWQDKVPVTIFLTFPEEESSLTIDSPVIVGSRGFMDYIIPRRSLDFLLGFLLLAIGFLLICSSLLASSLTTGRTSFLWLGSFALITGLWDITNSEITHLFFQRPISLYLTHRICSFLILIPLGQFTIQAVNLKKSMHLKVISLVMVFYALISVVLQFCGLISFTKSLVPFIILVAASIFAYVGVILYELIVYHNKKTFYFLIPMTVLVVFALLRSTLYYRRPNYLNSNAFQICILVFFLSLCASGISQIINSVRKQYENRLHENELRLLNIRLSEQLRHQEDMISASEELRRRRHDFRHYLAVIKEYNQNGKTKEIDQLIDEQLSARYVASDKVYCENEAVNAVLSYYHSLGQENGISMEFRVELPASLPKNVSENELCVLFGNLLENAIEACAYIKDSSKRFILLKASFHMNTYVITMENAFDGTILMKDNLMISRKRDEVGIGLMSIKGIAKKRKGEAYFSGEDELFHSRIYLNYDIEESKQ